MRLESILPTTCVTFRSAPLSVLGACMLLIGASAQAQDSTGADWPVEQINPAPLPDDLLLPMPCGGAMAFRKVFVPDQGPLNDYAITVGGTEGDRGYLEHVRPEHIAGSFLEGDERYYLIGKYEVSRLQYGALDATCPESSLEGRLPQTSLSWFDALAFANRYNRWLRTHVLSDLPHEGKEAGFVRLPTEIEWEFAARGGIAVSQADYSERTFPMPDGVVRYVWYAGTESANGKAQLIGLLKPSPLGLHDILGNVDEMVFEPFRLNRLNRLHGQAGGYVVRGGNYFTSLQEVRSSHRQEVPYYKGKEPRGGPTTGFRLALVAPVITSRDRLKQIEQAWSELGSLAPPQQAVPALSAEALDDPVKELDVIADAATDENMQKRLKNLRAILRASIQERDDQRKTAAKASLRLGGFLCQKIAGDGQAVDSLAEIVQHRREAFGEEDERLKSYQEQLAEERAVLDGILEYYAETVINSAAIYDEQVLNDQLAVLSSELTRKGYEQVVPSARAHHRHLLDFIRNPAVDRAEWLEQCKSL